jgi:hypothetical protein
VQAEVHALNQAARLESLAEGRYASATSPAYANMAGPFGGATAAVLINAVMLDARRLADPIALTTYFHIDADELAAIGATALLGEADTAIFHNGFADQTCALWTPDGRLIANGVQITWYKE